MFQTFWTSINMIAYITNMEIFHKKPHQTFLGLNLKAHNYRYLTINYGIFLPKTLMLVKYCYYMSTKSLGIKI